MYVGDDGLAKNITLVKRFRVDGFKPMRAGKQKYLVTYKIDENGILAASATFDPPVETLDGNRVETKALVGFLPHQLNNDMIEQATKQHSIEVELKARTDVVRSFIRRARNVAEQAVQEHPLRLRYPATRLLAVMSELDEWLLNGLLEPGAAKIHELLKQVEDLLMQIEQVLQGNPRSFSKTGAWFQILEVIAALAPNFDF